MITLTDRLNFYAAMLKANTFTPSALAVAFVLLYRHLNGRTGRCDPSAATLACEAGLTIRGVEKAIAELRKSGWWRIDQGCGRGHTNSYTPQLETPPAGSGFGAGKGEQQFGVLLPKNPNGKVRKPEHEPIRTRIIRSMCIDRTLAPRARARVNLGLRTGMDRSGIAASGSSGPELPIRQPGSQTRSG